MKSNNLYKILLAVLVFFGITACEDRELIMVENQSAPIVMDLSASTLFLDQNFPANPALTVTWTAATYSVPTEIRYKVEASVDEKFTTPLELANVAESSNTVTFTVDEMNKSAITLGMSPAVSSKMYLRVVSYLGTGQMMSAVSNVTSLQITPYVLSYPDFYLVGGATAVDWTASAAQILYKDANLSYIYTYLKPGNFRFLGQQDWNPTNYSLNDPGIKENYRYFNQWPATIAPDTAEQENMIFSGAEGIYKITINAAADKKTLDIVPASVFGFNYETVYLVGSIAGNNWTPENAVEMTKTAEGVYEFTTAIENGTEFKILGQKSWGDLDWGNISGNGHTGFLGPKGDNGNIKFDGGGSEYKITVNIKRGTYSIVKL